MGRVLGSTPSVNAEGFCSVAEVGTGVEEEGGGAVADGVDG